MMKDFINIEKSYKKAKINLYNANPGSIMTHIAKCTIEQAINDLMQ